MLQSSLHYINHHRTTTACMPVIPEKVHTTRREEEGFLCVCSLPHSPPVGGRPCTPTNTATCGVHGRQRASPALPPTDESAWGRVRCGVLGEGKAAGLFLELALGVGSA